MSDTENLFEIPDAAILDDDLMAFEIGDTGIELGTLETLDPFDDFKGVNQAKETLTRMSCTMAGAVNQIHRLWRMNATHEYLVAVVNYAIEYKGFKPTSGWESRLGSSTARNKWNLDHKDKEVIFVTGTLFDELFWEALSKNYLIGVTFRGNSDYTRDYYKDGVLNGSVFKPASYGHRTNWKKSQQIYLKGGKICVHDQYEGAKYNVYDIEKFKELVDNGTYRPTYYLFLKADTVGKSAEEIKKEKMDKKAMEFLLYTLSSTYDSIQDSDIRTGAATLAAMVRKKLGVDNTQENINQKTLQATVNAISYGWNFAEKDTDVQRKLAEVAKEMREKFGLK